MKKLVLLIATVFLSVVSYAGGKIDIRLKNCISQVVYITGVAMYSGASTWQDSVVLKNGAAVFEMPQNDDYQVMLRPKVQDRTRSSILNIRVVEFDYFRGDELKIEADFGAGIYVPVRISGSEIYEAHAAFFPEAFEIYEREIQRLQAKLNVLNAMQLPDAEMTKYRARQNELWTKIKDIKIGYIREHPDSPLSAMYCSQLPFDISGSLYEGLSDRVKNGKYKNAHDAGQNQMIR